MDELLKEMFRIGCVKISPQDPFTYASGLTGPIYCDNRLIPSHPHMRKLVAQGFSNIIDRNNITYQTIAGVATAGISHSAFLAEYRNEPMAYVRSKPKGHGKGRMIEGDVEQGDRLLLVEDLINQGSSISKVIEGVRNTGYQVDHALCIVDYQMNKAQKSLKNLKVEHFSLISFDQIADMALKLEIIDALGYESLRRWHNNPHDWS
jgi:orotate phosphoribosyltransferase